MLNSSEEFDHIRDKEAVGAGWNVGLSLKQ
jgi:hypothetical protein